ncbi:RloB family protein [Microcoleus sp. C2C3]|uniref:RloB family protein n=1 Tax=unclassified Microcoleus TaxID=2642155 RepID=UPI002FCEE718
MAKREQKSRGYSTRKVNEREVRQRFLIVCEAEKTEPNYFKSFRVPKNVIDVKGVGENPSNLVESARRYNSLEDYDQVWCVFDRDNWKPQDFNNAIQNAENQNFKVAYSNEAFELWYVLHFEFLNTGIPRTDYCHKLTNLMGKKYQKNSEHIYDKLIDKQDIAIKNSKKLLKQYPRQSPVQDNPSTTVHLLVEELNKSIP